jgi:acetyl esterase/lipase
LTLKGLVVAALVVNGCSFVACESREQTMRAAEERAKAWGYPAPRVLRDLVYAEYGQRRLTLDLYQPLKSGQGAVPGIVVVRGGAFRQGDKVFFGYIAGALAMEGFVAASIEYRTSDEATFPAAAHDVKAAVRWMRAHAADYGINPDAIGAIGGSAGAHLVAMLATTGGLIELEGAGGNPGVSSDVQAVVAMGGAYNLQSKRGVSPDFIPAVSAFIGAPLEADAETIAAASPVTYVSSRSAPLLLLHSRTDPDVPFEYAVEIEQRYRKVGASVTLKAIQAPGIHAFWGDPLCCFSEARRLFVEFFGKNLKRQTVAD